MKLRGDFIKSKSLFQVPMIGQFQCRSHIFGNIKWARDYNNAHLVLNLTVLRYPAKLPWSNNSRKIVEIFLPFLIYEAGIENCVS